MRRAVVVIVGLFAYGCIPSTESKTSGHVGCRPEEIKITGENISGGFGRHTETWTAQCRGQTFYCSELVTSGGEFSSSQVSCRQQANTARAAEPSPPSRAIVAAPKASPPRGAAGFELGQMPDRLKSTCEAAGKQWATVDSSLARCSGAAVDMGFPVEVELIFSGDRAAAITIVHVPQSGWSKRLAELRAALANKYGREHRRQIKLPPSCKAEADFAECLRNGSAAVEYDWAWESGDKIALAAGRRKGADPQPIILLRYEKPIAVVSGSGL